MSPTFWSTLMAKVVENLPLNGIDKELMYSNIFGTRWLEDYKSTCLQRGVIQTPSDTYTKTNASGTKFSRGTLACCPWRAKLKIRERVGGFTFRCSKGRRHAHQASPPVSAHCSNNPGDAQFGTTAPHLKEVATDEPETRADGWAGQLFIQRAGGRTEIMTATSDDTIRALKAQMRLPGERLVWGRRELCQDDRTLGSYGVPKEVRPHQSPLSHHTPPPHPPLSKRNCAH